MKWRQILLLCIQVVLIPTMAFADEITYLNFTVSNLSNTRIFFKSTDIFDFGKAVKKNETKTITYDFPPKVISLTLSNESNQPYELLTDSSCDMLGWPAFRQWTKINRDQDIKGMGLYKAGNIHIIVSDINITTPNKKHLFCTISNS